MIARIRILALQDIVDEVRTEIMHCGRRGKPFSSVCGSEQRSTRPTQERSLIPHELESFQSTGINLLNTLLKHMPYALGKGTVRHRFGEQ